VKTRKRTKSRECALQLLYQKEFVDKGKQISQSDFWERAIKEGIVEKDELDIVKDFANKIYCKTVEHLEEIDNTIRSCATNWDMKRIALIDRNILRIGICEITYFDDIPDKVAINESIELAKKFGDSESSRFVNGILDEVAKKHR
jgi:N utilization substance protein B